MNLIFLNFLSTQIIFLWNFLTQNVFMVKICKRSLTNNLFWCGVGLFFVV